ncbi:hypothetical protein BGT96224_5446 [Blumeria graminis f. sp. tritici 96224]|nr:hypothetical protein BGT96224_5446 [Blumeria graminis f. sp. tritici 96224]
MTRRSNATAEEELVALPSEGSDEEEEYEDSEDDSAAQEDDKDESESESEDEDQVTKDRGNHEFRKA